MKDVQSEAIWYSSSEVEDTAKSLPSGERATRKERPPNSVDLT